MDTFFCPTGGEVPLNVHTYVIEGDCGVQFRHTVVSVALVHATASRLYINHRIGKL